MKRFLFRFFIFVAGVIVLVELFFRFIIPAGDIALTIQDRETGFILYDTTGAREGQYTSGRLAQQRSHFRINNFGWNSRIDYFPAGSSRKPVIAVIGDSQIEGFYVNTQEHTSALLQALLNDRYDVYSFGQIGAPLSQEMSIARYAASHFDPEVFIFLIEEEHLKESVREYFLKPRCLQIQNINGQFIELPSAFSYHPSRLKRILRHSALVRYLRYNVRLTMPGVDRDLGLGERVETDGSAYDTLLFKQAAEYLVRRIVQDHPGKKIVFAGDCGWTTVATGKPAQSMPEVRWLRTACEQTENYLLDLAPVFAARDTAHPVRFRFGHDFHWNAYGHRICAEALYDFMMRNGIVKQALLPK